MKRSGKMKLGLSMRSLGYHVAAWRHPDAPPLGALNFESFYWAAQAAERAKFDMVFFADSLSVRGRDEPKGAAARSSWNLELEPITVISALAPLTKNIGLVATASTTYNEPFHLARKFASVDFISGGRAGWNMVTSWSDDEAKNFSQTHTKDYDFRYERGAEFIDVVNGLWDSWDDDAIERNQQSGVFYDATKVHSLNHVGKHFKVAGPLTVARTPQGRPIIVQAGESEQGREIAAASADVVYTASDEIQRAKAFYASVKGRMEKYGRPMDALKILPGLTPFVGRTLQEAQDKHDQLQELIDPLVGLGALSRKVGDLSDLPLDEPLTRIAGARMKSAGDKVMAIVKEENLTLRQLYQRFASANGSRVVIGTASQIADTMQEWYEAYAADGFNITAARLPADMESFGELVVPELQRRGVFRTEYEASTLRENLGLPSAESRYAGGEGVRSVTEILAAAGAAS
ncbi:monooxygenase [Caballeronia hypogeia]|uniref:Monooxygenase n=1 Tax=Caballeronia hypogeia TaxID=1777140 RepID=A0A158DQT4_9BURK|nr:LLM class flavin-dependent oxidoreductase [Caballeronia hypogeia]SAK97001.1 monooxygenase [Caballeronia hypogeia]